jgi:hypothetical protein
VMSVPRIPTENLLSGLMLKICAVYEKTITTQWLQ